MRFKEISDGIWEDQKTGLQWTKTFIEMPWQDAVDFCANLEYGGYSDWRLPTINELEAIIDKRKHNPASKLPDTVSSYYWSSTASAYYTDYAWGVNFDYGGVLNCYKSNSYYVRAVRGGQKRICSC